MVGGAYVLARRLEQHHADGRGRRYRLHVGLTGAFMGYPQILHCSRVDGPALTAAAAATCIPTASKLTLPNSLWYVGRGLRITASGRISSVITTPGTARFDIRLGGTVVFDSLAILLDTVAAHTNVGWWLDVLLTCRVCDPAASTTFMGQGRWTCEDILGVPATAPKGVLTAVLPWNSAPAVGSAVDMSQALTLDMFFTQTAATGSMTVHQYQVELISPTNE